MITATQPSTLTLKTAVNSADLAAIGDIATITWNQTFTNIIGQQAVNSELERWYSIEGLQEQINAGETFLLIETEARIPVAYFSYSIETAPRELLGAPLPLPALKLHKLYCLPNQQGKGIGQFAVEQLKTIAHQHHCHTVMLLVNRQNPAVAFYKHQGFRILKNWDSQPGEVKREDYVMITLI